MQNKKENYYPDRTYKNSAKNGTIKEKSGAISYKPKRFVRKQKTGRSYIKALFSTRWTTNGATIVITRQPDTTNESYILAKQLKVEMTNELVENNRFVNNYDEFMAWFSEKEEILKDNNFHKLKD